MFIKFVVHYKSCIKLIGLVTGSLIPFQYKIVLADWEFYNAQSSRI